MILKNQRTEYCEQGVETCVCKQRSVLELWIEDRRQSLEDSIIIFFFLEVAATLELKISICYLFTLCEQLYNK